MSCHACSILRGDGSGAVEASPGGRSVLSDRRGLQLVLPAEIGAGWAPFNGPSGQVGVVVAHGACSEVPLMKTRFVPTLIYAQSLLGQVDLAFLGTYAIGMFFAGHLGDRVDLRYFLTAGWPTA